MRTSGGTDRQTDRREEANSSFSQFCERADRLSKNFQISVFMKICPVGAELFHADERRYRQTDRREEANSSFSQFCERADRLSKNSQISVFMKICPVGAELFHADGRKYRRTDTKKLIVHFLNFANAP